MYESDGCVVNMFDSSAPDESDYELYEMYDPYV
jgi:hypothetical protein